MFQPMKWDLKDMTQTQRGTHQMNSRQWEQKVGWRRKVAMNLCPLTWCTRRRMAPRRRANPAPSLNSRVLRLFSAAAPGQGLIPNINPLPLALLSLFMPPNCCFIESNCMSWQRRSCGGGNERWERSCYLHTPCRLECSWPVLIY